MAWEDVPALLTAYQELKYAPEGARSTLLSEFNAVDLDDVPEHRRTEFEEQLRYRHDACVNLAKSAGKRGPLWKGL